MGREITITYARVILRASPAIASAFIGGIWTTCYRGFSRTPSHIQGPCLEQESLDLGVSRVEEIALCQFLTSPTYSCREDHESKHRKRENEISRNQIV